MKFGPVQKQFFAANDGAYSVVTAREVYDSQITLTGEEVDLVTKFFGANGIHHGNVRSNPQAALKKFIATDGDSVREVGLNLVFCKPDKSELRLYLRQAFMPKPGQIWFLFVKDDNLHIGALDEEKWRSLGREDQEDESYIADIYNEPKSIKYTQSSGGLFLKRDASLALARIKHAGHKCEFNPDHKLFTARSTGMPFLEAHHLIPIKYQFQFEKPLDIGENIFALCPYCHRAVHHASVEETKVILDKLFTTRKEVGAILSVNTFNLYRFYNCEEITE